MRQVDAAGKQKRADAFVGWLAVDGAEIVLRQLERREVAALGTLGKKLIEQASPRAGVQARGVGYDAIKIEEERL